ncbi:MAG: beta-ketoacyl-[acyl-carrier-protein] synthase II [Planctomycetia bacterium]|nr:beta-ketoacyl-[acyl-carrier-protein] synthase II [Planctomycetia bacterium]
MKRRVVVTGLGVVTSLGRSVEAVWERLLRGDSGVGPITLFDVSAYEVRFAGEVPWNAEQENVANPKELRRLDRFTQFAMAAAADAVADAGLDFSREDPFRCGVVIGSGIGGLSEFEAQHERLLTKGVDKVSPFTIPKLMVNSGSGHVSSMFGIKGPNFAVATACASAANSIGEALRAIQYRDADVMIAGGSEAALTPMGLAGFQNMRAGAGVIVLEEFEHARRRGARIHCELLGYGASGDAGHITQPDEQGRGAARAMQMALDDAGLDGQRVAYVNAHGTSTPLGDRAETVAVKRVFGGHAARLAISSTKSQLGHTLGASGGIEAVVCALTIGRGVITPTINLEHPDPECDLDYTPNVARETRVDVAMSNSFGFGGHNASLVLGRLP